MAHAPTRKRWGKLRLRILDRDGYRCQCKGCAGCGPEGCGRAGRLDVDHRIPLDVAPDRMYDESNLQALCTFGCHRAKTRSENTPANPERDAWRVYLAARMASMR